MKIQGGHGPHPLSPAADAHAVKENYNMLHSFKSFFFDFCVIFENISVKLSRACTGRSKPRSPPNHKLYFCGEN